LSCSAFDFDFLGAPLVLSDAEGASLFEGEAFGARDEHRASWKPLLAIASTSLPSGYSSIPPNHLGKILYYMACTKVLGFS
jgi:hypothetical protein